MRLGRRGFSLLGALAALPLPRSAASEPEATVVVEVLTAAAFELFPHRELELARYRTLAESFVSESPDAAGALAAQLGGAGFTVQPRAGRIAQMQAAQSRADFQAFRLHALMSLYNDLEVTRLFGYEGPSLSKGGYLERGFDDAKWIPEPAADAD